MDMSTVKTWVLMQDQLTMEEIEWIKALKVEVKAEALYNTVRTNGKTQKFCTGYHFELKTHCEKQETMLQLKYSTALQLISIVFPADETYRQRTN
jgi:hypothetical protein